MVRVISILASAIVVVVAFRRVWDRIKPIPQNTTDKCFERNPKDHSRTYTLDDIVAYSSYFPSTKRSSDKKQRRLPLFEQL